MSNDSSQRVFYFNARDGWRVGDLIGAANVPKNPQSAAVISSLVIPVVDVVTGLRETVNYQDLMIAPPDNAEQTKALEQLTQFREMFKQKVMHQTQLPNGSAAAAFDACEYKPVSPLTFLPSTIDALRVMYETYTSTRIDQEGVATNHLADDPCRVAIGGPLQICMKPIPSTSSATATTTSTENASSAAASSSSPFPALEGLPKASSLSFTVDATNLTNETSSNLPSAVSSGASAAAALCANNSSQSIFCMGAQTTLCDSVQHVLEAAKRLHATETQLSQFLLVCNIIASLTHDGRGNQKAIVSFSLQTGPGQVSSTETIVLKAIDVNISALDLDWVVGVSGSSSSSDNNNKEEEGDPLSAPDFLAGLVCTGDHTQREQAILIPRAHKTFGTIDGDKMNSSSYQQQQSGAGVPPLDAQDQMRKRFLATVDAITRLKLNYPSAEWIWQLAGGVMNALDISFNNNNEISSSSKGNSPTSPYARLSENLGCDEELLKQVISTPVQRDQAAKVLYRGFVRMILRKINAVLNPEAFVGDAHLSVVSAIAPTFPPQQPSTSSGKNTPKQSSSSTINNNKNDQQSNIPVGENTTSLIRHLFFEDITQIYMTRTHAENLALQREGCAIPELCRAVLDASDNYSVLKTLRARNGVLGAFDSLEKQAAGMSSTSTSNSNANQSAAAGSSSSAIANAAATPITSSTSQQQGENNNNENANVSSSSENQQQQQEENNKPVDNNFYYKPDDDLEECFDPAKKQQRISEQGHPKKVDPPKAINLGQSFTQLSGTPCWFGGMCRVLEAEHNLQPRHPLQGAIEKNTNLLFTITPVGDAVFRPAPFGEKFIWNFNVAEQLISFNFEANGKMTFQCKANEVTTTGQKAGGVITVSIQLMVPRQSGASSSAVSGWDDADLQNSKEDKKEMQKLLNGFARTALKLNQNANADYVGRPQPVAPVATATPASTPAGNKSDNVAAASAAATTNNDTAASSASASAASSNLFTVEYRRQIGSVFSALPQCATDMINGTVEVPHSFGSRFYRLPNRSDDGQHSGMTFAAPVFKQLKSVFTEKTKGVVQEVCLLEEQAVGNSFTYVSLLRTEIDGVLQKCLRSSSSSSSSSASSSNKTTSQLPVSWFSLQVLLPQSGQFDGMSVEQQISFLPFLSLPSLRAVQPQLLRRFLPIEFPWVAKQYMHILPLAKRRRFRVLYSDFKKKYDSQLEQSKGTGKIPQIPAEILRGVEEILLVANVGFRIGAVHALIDGSSLVKLEAVAARSREAGLTLVQALLRWRLSFALMTQRGTFVEAARAADRAEAHKTKQARQDALIQVRVLAERISQLIAEENSQRRDINDTMLVEWVALCAEARTEAEQRTERQLARKMLIEQRDDVRLGESTKRHALDALARRIRDRIAANGERLDHMVMRCVVQNEGSRVRQTKMESVHRNLLNMQVRDMEDKAMLELQVRAKTERILGVRDRVSKRVDDKRKISYQKHEAERLAREQLMQQEQARQERSREEAMFNDIERKIAKNIETELAERQRQQRDAVRQAHLEERLKHRDALSQNAKVQYRKTVDYERQQNDKMDEAEKKRERYNRLLWDAHEKERRAFEAAKSAEKKSEKTMTQGLLRAQTLLATPHVFVRGSDGKARMADASQHVSQPRSASRGATRQSSAAANIRNPQLDGFVMAGGKQTGRSLLPEDVWSNVIDSMSALSASASGTPTVGNSAANSSRGGVNVSGISNVAGSQQRHSDPHSSAGRGQLTPSRDHGRSVPRSLVTINN